MNIKMGGQMFRDVQIPLLWGTRAILQDQQGRLSVVDLNGDSAKLEIVGDEPAPNIEFLPTGDGFKILSNRKELYTYNPRHKTLTSISLGLPECQIGKGETRVGTSILSGNFIAESGVGIAVTQNGMAIGAPLPTGLAELTI